MTKQAPNLQDRVRFLAFTPNNLMEDRGMLIAEIGVETTIDEIAKGEVPGIGVCLVVGNPEAEIKAIMQTGALAMKMRGGDMPVVVMSNDADVEAKIVERTRAIEDQIRDKVGEATEWASAVAKETHENADKRVKEAQKAVEEVQAEAEAADGAAKKAIVKAEKRASKAEKELADIIADPKKYKAAVKKAK